MNRMEAESAGLEGRTIHEVTRNTTKEFFVLLRVTVVP